MSEYEYKYSPEVIEIFKYRGKYLEGSFGYGRLILFKIGTHDYFADLSAYSNIAEKPVAKLIRPMWQEYQQRFVFTKRVSVGEKKG